MKVIKKNEDCVILKFHWFEKNYGFILFILFFFLPESIAMLASFIISFSSLHNLFFILLFVLLLLFQLFLLFSYRYFLELNFEEKMVFTYVKILGIRIDLIQLPINNIISLNSGITNSQNGIICEINIETKRGLFKKPLLCLKSLSRRSRKFYLYYLDLINVLIVNTINERSYNVKSEVLITDGQEILLFDLNFNTLKNKIKEISNAKQFPIDPIVFFFGFVDSLWISLWILALLLGVLNNF